MEPKTRRTKCFRVKTWESVPGAGKEKQEGGANRCIVGERKPVMQVRCTLVKNCLREWVTKKVQGTRTRSPKFHLKSSRNVKEGKMDRSGEEKRNWERGGGNDV